MKAPIPETAKKQPWFQKPDRQATIGNGSIGTGSVGTGSNSWQRRLKLASTFLSTDTLSYPRQDRKVSLAGIFLLTTAVAITLGLVRILGPELSFSFFLAAYAFAPSLAFLAVWWLTGYSLVVRVAVAVVLLLGFAGIMALLCGYSYGLAAVPWVLIGTAIEWPGQLAVVLCLRWIAFSGSIGDDQVGEPTAGSRD